MSFVLVSPSTLSWFHVRAAAGRRSAWRSAGSTVASVRSTASIVAIRGWIIPTPLAMPVTRIERTASPSTSGRVRVSRRGLRPGVGRAEGLGRGREPGVGRGERRREAGDPRPDEVERQARPDDPGREEERPLDRDAERRREDRRDLRLVRVARGAGRGVGAAARRYDRRRAQPPLAARWARDRRTGAAAKAFGVKTAAAAAGTGRPASSLSVAMIARSGRPDALIPTAAPPARNPAGIARPPLDRREGGRQGGEGVGA